MNKFKDDLSDIYKGNKKIRLTKNDKILLSLFEKEITKNIQNGGEPDNVSSGTMVYNTFKDFGKSIYNVGKDGLYNLKSLLLTPKQKYENEIKKEIVSKNLPKYTSNIMTDIVYDDRCRKMINKFIDKATENTLYLQITKITILVQSIIELIYELDQERGEKYIANSKDIKSLYDNLCNIRRKIVDNYENLSLTTTTISTQISEEFTGYYNEIKQKVQDNIINEQDFKLINVDGSKKEISITEKPLLNMFINNVQTIYTIDDYYMSDINQQINSLDSPKSYISGIMISSISNRYEYNYKYSKNFYRDKTMNSIQQERLEKEKTILIFNFDKEKSKIAEKINEVINKQGQDYDSSLKTLFAYIKNESDNQYDTICKTIKDSSKPNRRLFIWDVESNQLKYNLVVIIEILKFINLRLNEIDVNKLSKETIKRLLEYIIWINDTSIIYNSPHNYNIPHTNQIIYQILNKFVIFRVFEQIYSKYLNSIYRSVKNDLIDPYDSYEKRISDMQEQLNKARYSRYDSSMAVILVHGEKQISIIKEQRRSKYQKDYDIYDNLLTFLSNTIGYISKELLQLPGLELKYFIIRLIGSSNYSPYQQQEIKNYLGLQSIGGKKIMTNNTYTIEESQIGLTGGRYYSQTPSGAAKKAATRFQINTINMIVNFIVKYKPKYLIL